MLEYRDARRGHEKRIAWRADVIDGFLLAGETSGAGALVDSLREGAPWRGPRHTVFLGGGTGRAPRERIVCNCKQVTQTQIADAVAGNADFAELKSTLGCGTVCGSCVPEIKRLLNAAALV